MSKSSTISAFKWNFADQFLNQIIGFGANLILIRLLEPEVFGLFAIPLVVFTFMRTFQDLGTTSIFFKEEKLEDGLIKLVLGLAVVTTILLAIVGLLFVKPLTILFSGGSDMLYIMQWMMVVFLLTVPLLVHEALLRKKMNFKALFWVNLLATVVSSAIGIGLAYKGLYIQSLLWKQVLYILICSGGYFIASRWWHRPSFQFQKLRKHMTFSLAMVGDQGLAFLARNLDTVFVGKYIGFEALGIYDRAYKFLTLPIQQVGGSMSKVLLPALSNEKTSEAKNKLLLKSLGMASTFLFPLMACFAVVSKEFTFIIMTEKWLGIVPLLMVFSILACFQTVTLLVINLFVVQGKSQDMFVFSLITKPIYILIFYVTTAIYKDIYLLAYCYAGFSILSSVFYWMSACKTTNLPLIQVLSSISHAILPSIIVALLVYLSKIYVVQIDHLWQLISIGFGAMLAYFILLKAFTNPYLEDIKRISVSVFKVEEKSN